MSQSSELAALLEKHRPEARALAPKVARALVRHAKALHRLYEQACSVELDPQATVIAEGHTVAHERAVKRLCETVQIRAVFNGDPRGFPVKLHFAREKPTAFALDVQQPFNTWGGMEDGWGIG